jgi:(4S)-4-hydroxy-5-phosphonooxypentane-2,3-dione isomerase
MHKTILTAIAAAALVVSLPSAPASAQSPAPYINLVELVVVPAELSKFLELAKDNAETAIKEPGVREFNVMQLATNPNHVVFYEVYDNEAALNAHRSSDHFKKYQAATANMVADRNVRALASVEFHSNGH